ncbi:MAG: hypothetical protein DRP59_01405 [Spirochaetes bacterium]|nr:MAG: hypothetical protein DRP59_01405 [Spirochaetota bacterium]
MCNNQGMEKFATLSELSSHLYEKIIEEKIRTFSELITYTGDIFTTPRRQVVLMSAFKLIRKLHWGFFKDIDYASYPKIWREIVIPHPAYKYAGDIKRNSTISNIYVSMLDVHGYTAFCKQNNRNLSMLQLLDDFIQGDIGKITQELNVISRRERGDEIVLVGTTASDIVSATLSIVDYFSKRKVVNSDALRRSRSGAKIILPDMSVSAGISGGKMYTPLVITEDGNLSGDVINTAARLQTRANKISPHSTRITVTNHVVFRYKKENAGEKKGKIRFFNSGIIDFKGTSIALYELVFRSGDTYVLQFQEEMQELYDAVRKKLWRNQVFPALLLLLIKVCRTMPPFRLKHSVGGNEDIITLAEKTLLMYRSQDNYYRAVLQLRKIVDYLSHVQNFDHLVFEYARKITELYEGIMEQYRLEVEHILDTRHGEVFPSELSRLYTTAKRNLHVYDKLKTQVMEGKDLINRKSIWYTSIERNLSSLDFTLYSGKK